MLPPPDHVRVSNSALHDSRLGCAGMSCTAARAPRMPTQHRSGTQRMHGHDRRCLVLLQMSTDLIACPDAEQAGLLTACHEHWSY